MDSVHECSFTLDETSTHQRRKSILSLVRKLEGFLGLRVVTYVVMGNHFHLLVEEPGEGARAKLDRDTLLKRTPIL